MFLHGLPILPNDIDVIVDTKGYNRAKELLGNYLISDTISLVSTSKIPFEIEGVECELVTFDIHDSNLVYKTINTSKIPINSLEIELAYYKQRTDKKVENTDKVALIEEALRNSSNT